ncbi:MAG TPA: hypothetical protein VFE28_14185 [Candidatus Krumholzibacteria bacterium]|nr:hypothetical protein [Candidatus Krumholzibacteria bacterium]
MLRLCCSLGLLFLVLASGFRSAAVGPAVLEPGDAGVEPATAALAAWDHDHTSPATDATGSGWWQERKKRFQELALCALSSANVTYLLLAGFSGAGGAISLAIATVGVLVCL